VLWDEVKDVEVIMVFEPTWTKDMMSEEAKLGVGLSLAKD